MMDVKHRWNLSFQPLIAGFILSLILTLAAWFAVTKHAMATWLLIAIAVGLGSLQMFLQMILFLNLGIESKPRWNVMMFIFMLIVLLLVVAGSMWIMYHLNYNMMPMGDH